MLISGLTLNRSPRAVACALLIPAATLFGPAGTAHAGPQSDDCAAALVRTGDSAQDKAEKVCDGAANETGEPGLEDCVAALVRTQGIPAGRAKGVCDGSRPAGS